MRQFTLIGCIAVTVLLWNSTVSCAAFSSIAFFYGANPPVEELRGFDLAVIDPGQLDDPSGLSTPFTRPVAYVSLGEADPKRPYTRDIPREWYRGENKTWGTMVLDQSNKEWQQFFVSQVLEPLWQKGFRGFFLDTADSYRIAYPASEWPSQEEGIASIIADLKKRHPDAVIVLNRGFEILPRVQGMVDAVAAESLFRRWDESSRSYGEVPEKDRQWLIGQLNGVREHGAIPVVIDYLPPEKRDLARETARRIADLGFLPWVSDRYNDSLGIGSVEVMPRRIFGIYDASESADPAETLLHVMAEMPLNHLGYILEMHDVRNPLPKPLPGRYAGILVWTNSYSSGVRQNLDSWLLRQIESGLRVVFLDYFGFPPTKDNLAPFGIDAAPAPKKPSVIRIVSQDPSIGYEIPPTPRMDIFTPLKATGANPLLVLENEQGLRSDAVAITPWGGYALYPYLLARLPDKQTRWVVDPFSFFRDSLRLPEMPVPDTTTENGRRLLMVHVDGDGFMEPAQWGKGEFAAEVMSREIFNRYRVPTTVSVIQGEISSSGMYARLSDRLEAIARSIFALPWVEIASHSYSHPFDWGKAEEKKSGGKYQLAIPGYTFSLAAEIQGSIDYINRELAPPGKSCRLFLWSGDCLPTENALAAVDAAGILAMNGGNTIITGSRNSLSNVSPLGIWRNARFQVYSPNQNENVYTNLWTGPFYGYERAIETFRLTDSPIRLKPVDIYYHFYSASKQPALAALRKVYDWALSREPFHIFASEYVEKVHDFNRTVISRSQNGWLVRNTGFLREFRMPAAAGFPDIAKGRNIAGYSDHGKDRYIHIGPGGESLIPLSASGAGMPYLKEANGRITSLERSGNGMSFRLEGQMPLSMVLAGMEGYSVTGGKGLREDRAVAPGIRSLSSSQTGDSIVVTRIR